MTARAARWATRRAGAGRAIKEIAAELGCNWHTAMAAVHLWGRALLDADRSRIEGVTALGLDEILMFRRGRYRDKHWGTTVVDARRGVLLDIVAGRSAQGAKRWIQGRTSLWRRRVRWAVMDLSGPYRKAFGDALPKAIQVADPFHVVKLANSTIDDVRRRVHNETTGGRGTKGDALYRIRRLLLKAHERVTERGEAKLRGLLAAGDPHGEVRDAWHAKETLRMTYRIGDHELALEALDELSRDLRDDTYSPELNKLGRTLRTWRAQITNWHRSRVTNGPTKAANNLAKLIKRVSFGITNLNHYRTRVLLYAGKPNWNQLDTPTPRQNAKSPQSTLEHWQVRATTRINTGLCVERITKVDILSIERDSFTTAKPPATTAAPSTSTIWCRLPKHGNRAPTTGPRTAVRTTPTTSATPTP